MIPAGLLFQTNIEGVSVGVAMEEKKFCPAGTSGGLIKWRHLLTTCRVAIKKTVTEYTWLFYFLSGGADLPFCFENFCWNFVLNFAEIHATLL